MQWPRTGAPPPEGEGGNGGGRRLTVHQDRRLPPADDGELRESYTDASVRLGLVAC